MATAIRKSRKGFSLIELVIVVVIIGIIAAIAIPKMSRGATGAGEAALSADLQVLRNALEMYQAEHNGLYPDPNSVTLQLTQTTDVGGNIVPPGTVGIVTYGPYLKTIPGLPVGSSLQRGQKLISAGSGAAVGWIYTYDPSGATISANATGNDSQGTAYTAY